MVAGLYASPASAAEPAQQGCLGESFSGFATQVEPPLFGQTVVFTARVGGPLSTQPGIGDTIQILLAGDFPEGALPNSCND